MIASEALSLAKQRLREAGVEDAGLEAEILLRDVWSIPRERLYTSLKLELVPDVEARYAAVIARRCEREPLAYITGKREFYGISFIVSGDVLVPRPETEHVVEEVLRLIAPIKEPLVADVGTGSGAIAVAVAANNPRVQVYATDLSHGALALARRNAIAQKLDRRISFLHGDLAGPLPRAADVIAANLPYIPTGEIPGLQPEVRDYEPIGALDGGPDGLDLIRRLVTDAPAKLRPGGSLVLEVAMGQAQAAAALATPGFGSVVIRKDLAGIERVVCLRLSH